MRSLHHTIMNTGSNAGVVSVRAAWHRAPVVVVVNGHTSVHQSACKAIKAD